MDVSFNPSDAGFGTGDGANGSINSISIQADGKFIVGGGFLEFNGTSRSGIARLNPNGTVDPGFNPGSGVDYAIEATAVQADGKVVIGGFFSHYNSTLRNYIARVYANGQLDLTFNPGSGANNGVYAVAIQPTDGKILIGGAFTTYNGTSKGGIARIKQNGSLDTSFSVGGGANGVVEAIIVQPDGKVLIGGNFTTVNGVARNHLARLNSDGTLDISFDPGGLTDGEVRAMALQADGKVVFGGSFINYNSISRNNIARANSDGTVDLSFDPGNGTDNSVNSIAVQADGKIVLGGAFTSYDGLQRNHIVRITASGANDVSFNPGTGTDNDMNAVAIQTDGKLLIAGLWTSYNGTTKNYIARLNGTGSLDLSFLYPTGANKGVYAIAVQGDGKILIGGVFNVYNGATRSGVARLKTDGTLDSTFVTGAGTNLPVYAIALQADGKILIGGSFTSYNGNVRNHLARLNADGSLDPSFNTGNGADSTVYSIRLQLDGKILIGGAFSGYNGYLRNRIARLNPDGVIDNSFSPGTGADAEVLSICILPTGKIVLGGYFTHFNGSTKNHVVQIAPNGSIDAGFDAGLGPNNSVRTVAYQANFNRIIITGAFNSFGGALKGRIARLNLDGTLDPTFNSGTGANDSILTCVTMADGRMLIGGYFTQYNGSARNYITRLNSDGSADNTYTSSANDAVMTIALQTDPKALIGGLFTAYNNIGRNRVARISNTIITTGVSDMEIDRSITVAPNPVQSVLRIEDKRSMGALLLRVFNASGIEVMNPVRFTSSYTLDMRGLAPGVYVTEIISARTGEKIDKKIVKQ